MFRKHRKPTPPLGVSVIEVVPVCTNCWEPFSSIAQLTKHRARPCPHLDLRPPS